MYVHRWILTEEPKNLNLDKNSKVTQKAGGVIKKKKKKKTPHRPKSVARELIPCRHFEPARVKPN